MGKLFGIPRHFSESGAIHHKYQAAELHTKYTLEIITEA